MAASVVDSVRKWHVTSRSAWGYLVGRSLGGAGFLPWFLPWLLFLRFSHPSTVVVCVVCSVGGCLWAAGALAALAYVQVVGRVFVAVFGLLLSVLLLFAALFSFLLLSCFGLSSVDAWAPVGFAGGAGLRSAERSSCCTWVTQVPSEEICLESSLVLVWIVVSFLVKSCLISAEMVL